jgi:cation transport ATPase
MATRPHSDTDDGPRLHTHEGQHAIGMSSDPAVGHTMHADHSVEVFRQKFWGTLLLSIATYGGWVLIKAAASELANRLPGMMTLIALGISVAFIFSLAVTFGFPGVDLWKELATLVTVMVLGPLDSDALHLSGARRVIRRWPASSRTRPRRPRLRVEERRRAQPDAGDRRGDAWRDVLFAGRSGRRRAGVSG